jgi:hypothetical protein
MPRNLVPIALLLPLWACGDKEPGEDTDTLAGEEISCDWFAGDNCWKEQVASAASCAAPDGSGTFNADFTVCSYGDGTEIHFDTPAPAVGSPTEDEFFDYAWNFEILIGGSTCLSFTTDDTTWSVETPEGTFSSYTHSGTTQYSCPSGEQYTIGAMSLFTDCDWDTLPGTISMSGGSLALGLTGGADDLTLFSCQGPG